MAAKRFEVLERIDPARRPDLLRGRLNELEKKLSMDQFFRIHRSTIFNLDRVKEFQPLFKGEELSSCGMVRD